MNQVFDLRIDRSNGFANLSEAMGHRRVVGKLMEKVELAQSTAAQLVQADDVQLSGNQDLAPGKGHVILLSKTPDGQDYGAELKYNPKDGNVSTFELQMPGSKLTQLGSSFKLEEGGVTTYFRPDNNRGVLAVMDSQAEIPRIFGDADPNKLTGGALQSGQGILMF